MRIIAGRFRSRKLRTVPGSTVRPTPDRLREALFNVIAPRLAGRSFLDAYAGSGAVGIEALSRGASRVILIERNSKAVEVIRSNLEDLGAADEVEVARGSASALLKQYTVDIVFIDPPYELTEEYDHSLSASTCELAIAQHSSRRELKEQYGKLKRFRVLRQGDNTLSFYRPEEDEHPSRSSPSDQF